MRLLFYMNAAALACRSKDGGKQGEPGLRLSPQCSGRSVWKHPTQPRFCAPAENPKAGMLTAIQWIKTEMWLFGSVF